MVYYGFIINDPCSWNQGFCTAQLLIHSYVGTFEFLRMSFLLFVTTTQPPNKKRSSFKKRNSGNMKTKTSLTNDMREISKTKQPQNETLLKNV